MTPPAILLSRDDVSGLMRPADYLAAVESAFSADKEGRAHAPSPMHIAGKGGDFHAKGASYDAGRPYVAVKLNGNFPGNFERTGLPTIQGAILLCDAQTGSILAIIDSIEITLQRTAAASALAARYLARANASTLFIIGCGDQAIPQAVALSEILPLQVCRAFDLDVKKAEKFSQDIARQTGMVCTVANEVGGVTACDVIVTCTTARSPILTLSDISPGTFIAAVGADSPEKHEIAPELMAAATVVVDVLSQCVEMGDLHHAIVAGALSVADVYADLGELVTGAKRGRFDESEIIIFDSTGTALQDVASAALAYERAIAGGVGTRFALANRPKKLGGA
jgi:ornithine cyclodeaminase/alanine dehydrogenase-like protein (mu-crystallin family)